MKRKFSNDQIFTAILGVLIMIASFFCAGVCFAIIENCGVPQAINEYFGGCIFGAICAGLMYAYAIYESNQ